MTCQHCSTSNPEDADFCEGCGRSLHDGAVAVAQPMPERTDRPPQRTIRNLRWWIGGSLFLITVINYIDRQTLNALSPYLKAEFHWNNEDYAFILNAFRIAYTIMQSVFGWLLDVIGTHRGISISVGLYSVVAAATALATGKLSFAGFRFMLACGESANNPAGSKTVSEWFPAKERALACALFDSGSSIGGALAPLIVLGVFKYFHSWRPAFLLTATLGFGWLFLWRWIYHPPEKHPRLSAEELEYIKAGRASDPFTDAKQPHVTLGKLLSYRQTWGILMGRFFLDPYWFFMAEWFPLFLRSKGFTLEQSVLGFWVPFLGADMGHFFGGWLSGWLIRRGWPIGRSRRTLLGFFGPSMLVLSLTAASHNYVEIVLLFGYTSFAYACCGTMFFTLPTDVFHSRAVGTVMGLGGTGAGIGTMISTFLIGWVTDTKAAFGPVVIAASIIPCIATVIFVTMVRARKTPDPDGIVLSF